jgi:hypothetical protein
MNALKSAPKEPTTKDRKKCCVACGAEDTKLEIPKGYPAEVTICIQTKECIARWSPA